MREKEIEALEMLKTGVSWREAERRTKISEERLKAIFEGWLNAEAERQKAMEKVK